MADKESTTHEKASTAHHDELSRAKARIAELEEELNKKHKGSRRDDTRRDETHRVADSFSDASRNKIDTASRMIRGLSMASIEGGRVC